MRFIQLHHHEPWARGGGETVDNLAILCAAHNRLLAERDFGKELLAQRIASHKRQAPGPTHLAAETTRAARNVLAARSDCDAEGCAAERRGE